MTAYVPDKGDIAWLDFSPQAGREQAKRRPAIVLSGRRYNAGLGFALVCPITTKLKGYIFEVPLPDAAQTTGAVLADQLRSFDWRARRMEFCERAPQDVLDEVLAKIAALLGL